MAKTSNGQTPFDPPGVAWTPVSPKLVGKRYLTLGIGTIIFLIPTLAVPAIFFRDVWWAWVAAGLVLLFAIWDAILIPRQVRAIGYAERDEDLLLRQGILFRSLVVVPYGRMQFVDVEAGPLDRAFGLASVQLHTASAGTDAAIPGLTPDEAARLRDRLSARGESRLAGL